MGAKQVTFSEIGSIFRDHNRFVIVSHVRPDGDAIGSQLALGESLRALGKTVFLINEDGLPKNLAFLAARLPENLRVLSPPEIGAELDAEVVIALDTANRERIGAKTIAALGKARLWVNIDHHISNENYGDFAHVDAKQPAVGAILYEFLTAENFPINDVARDALYVAISTDTGSFRYPDTTSRIYEIAADLVRRGVDVGKINQLTYDAQPLRRVKLMQALLNSLEISGNGRIASWDLTNATKLELDLKPEDSDGTIDFIRSIDGVIVALSFEEMELDGKIRISLRSKTREVDVCKIAQFFGGGGHPLASGLRMRGPLEDAKSRLLTHIESVMAEARLEA